MKTCDHCGGKLGKKVVLIIPGKIEINLGIAKIETICLKCAKKEGRETR